MLLSFKVKNYLSFKDEAWFSMEANKKIRTLWENKNIIKLKDWENLWLNKTAIFYWANASWKTNIFKWLDFLKFITLNSFKFDIEWWINHQFLNTFLLNQDTQKENIEFEMEFLIDRRKYKYFIELNEKEILKEKLSYYMNKKEIILFEIIKTWDWKKLEQDISFCWVYQNLLPRNNQTYISFIANKDSKWELLATKIIKFFIWLNFIQAKSDPTFITLPMVKNEEIKKIILNFINNADINIDDIKQEEREYDEKDWGIIEINWQRIIPNKVVETNFIHPVYKDGKKITNIWFNLLKQESEWTRRLFWLLWPILDTIQNNWILLIDEIDTHMHFLLVENLIRFFHWIKDEWKNNVWDSQFIFNTHNLDLMDLELFKKDQIFFTSKNYYWATEIYSLDDFKDIQIRNNSDIKKAYKLWVFWAIPILSDFNLQ